jgi:AcrR family transcriptional regulator
MESSAQARKDFRREQEFQRRRQEIMSAARTLFVEKGLRNTTLDEIAEASAFGKGTLYNYFANKDDLFRAIIHQLIDEINAATATAMAEAPSTPREQLRAYTRVSLEHFHANTEVFLMIMRDQNDLDAQSIDLFKERYQTRLSMVIGPLQKHSCQKDCTDTERLRLALLFDGMIRAYFMAVTGGLWPTDNQSPADVAEFMVSTFFDGIENKQTQG